MSRDSADSRTAAELIDRLGRLLRAESHAGGLNPAQWEALRYLARCNRFSNTAGALARYLGATKGTVSQTLNALERKKLLTRMTDPLSARVIRLTLTAAGRALLARDPLQHLATATARLPEGTLAGLTAALEAMLAGLLRDNNHRPFGACHTCRNFRRDAPGGGPHWCALLQQPLSKPDSLAICAEHEPRAA